MALLIFSFMSKDLPVIPSDTVYVVVTNPHVKSPPADYICVVSDQAGWSVT